MAPRARQDPRTSRFQIAIAADDGVVAPGGLIDMGLEPLDGIEVATKVPGVKEVVNRVRTAIPGARHIVAPDRTSA